MQRRQHQHPVREGTDQQMRQQQRTHLVCGHLDAGKDQRQQTGRGSDRQHHRTQGLDTRRQTFEPKQGSPDQKGARQRRPEAEAQRAGSMHGEEERCGMGEHAGQHQPGTGIEAQRLRIRCGVGVGRAGGDHPRQQVEQHREERGDNQ